MINGMLVALHDFDEVSSQFFPVARGDERPV
jgi:hypothetical protein